MGECIHVAEVRVPSSVVADVTDRTAAVAEAKAMPLFGAVVDPRIPGLPVPAVVKWANDELDSVPDTCGKYFSGSAIEAPMKYSQNQTVSGYRHLRSQDLAFRVDGACASRAVKPLDNVDPAADIDTAWDEAERHALHHIIQTLTLIGSVVHVDFNKSQLHARHETGGVEITAIYGSTHSQCVNAFRRLAERTYSPVLLVTRDAENARHLPREAELFADPRGSGGLKFTDSQTLLDAARNKTVQEYTEFIGELLNVQDRPII
jgi:hypothetical protein